MWILVAVLAAYAGWCVIRIARSWQQLRAVRRRESERWMNRFREKGR